jgi:outer membrane murein-binding lipoprotein Lpp
MNHRILTIAAALTIGLLSASTAEAAKKNKEGKGGERAVGQVLGRFDRDNNGSLDQKESKRVQQLCAGLKRLDSYMNGELSESEIAAAKVEKAQRKGGKGKGGKAGKGKGKGATAAQN